MKRVILFFITLAALAASYTSFAQNLDPTVVVNRAYEGKLLEVHKPSFDMEVPDSVTRFDLDFDYSVFEKPYEGAYEFSPYILTMRPASAVYNPKQLYLRAGAGYTLHPTLDFVWTPALKGKFRMDVYVKHRSYVGDYRRFIYEDPGNDVIRLDRWVKTGGDHSHWKGYDLETIAGIDGVYDWFAGAFDFDVAYHGVALKDDLKTRMYDAVDAELGFSSKPGDSSYLKYDIRADYSYAVDKVKSLNQKDNLAEHLFNFDAKMGQVIHGTHNVQIDVDFDLASYAHPENSITAGQFCIIPHYKLSGDRWDVDAGLRMSKLFRSATSELLYAAKEQFVYPDINASYDLIADAMRVYAFIGGGNRMNTYSSLVERNHHFDMTYGRGIWPVMDFSVERVSTSIGLAGRVGARLSYDLRAGYVNYKNLLFDGVCVGVPAGLSEYQYLPGVGYSAAQKFFAVMDLTFKTEDVKFDADLVYNHFWGLGQFQGLYVPALLQGDVMFEYNWSKRIFAGADCIFSTARKGSILKDSVKMHSYIPGYADFGLYFEAALTHAFSIWLRGGNLLNMTIQRSPLYAEKGVNFTIGLCLNL